MMVRSAALLYLLMVDRVPEGVICNCNVCHERIGAGMEREGMTAFENDTVIVKWRHS